MLFLQQNKTLETFQYLFIQVDTSLELYSFSGVSFNTTSAFYFVFLYHFISLYVVSLDTAKIYIFKKENDTFDYVSYDLSYALLLLPDSKVKA